MDGFSSGLPAVWADARRFAAGVTVVRPEFAWLAVGPVAAAVLAWPARRGRRRALRRIGHPAAVAGLVTGPTAAGVGPRLAVAVGWLAVAVGAAGPAWGDGGPDGVAVGRDLVVVLDLSRSMLADDMTGPPTRWQAAVAAAVDLVAAADRAGGWRIGVVGFAARPVLLVPLTADLAHVAAALKGVGGDRPPPGVRPPADGPAASGTRIGAALKLAAAAHDPRFPAARDIVLISDGDDPAADDEWRAGVSAARSAAAPVHVVGVGDPARDTELSVLPGRPLTRLREAVLADIATEGRGAYVAARRDAPDLGGFFRGVLAAGASRELSDAARPRPRDRSAWFLVPGLLLLAVGWLTEGGR